MENKENSPDRISVEQEIKQEQDILIEKSSQQLSQSEEDDNNSIVENDDQNHHFYKEYCRLYYANIILTNRL